MPSDGCRLPGEAATELYSRIVHELDANVALPRRNKLEACGYGEPRVHFDPTGRTADAGARRGKCHQRGAQYGLCPVLVAEHDCGARIDAGRGPVADCRDRLRLAEP